MLLGENNILTSNVSCETSLRPLLLSIKLGSNRACLQSSGWLVLSYFLGVVTDQTLACDSAVAAMAKRLTNIF